jgi:GT2 family glycosyltransferase
MSKVLIGAATFGNTMFTAKAFESCKNTAKHEVDFFAVVGKPGDVSTVNLLEERGIPYVRHDINKGFPASVNDIYDYAFKENDYDSVIIIGNDIVAYPYCIDSLIDVADTTDYLVISALQYDVRDLVREHEEASKYFSGGNCIITDLSQEPWNLFTNYSSDIEVLDNKLYDVQNCCLYKREVFDRIGYTDVNFYPAYFIDNDYVKRILVDKIKYCSLGNARFFHFWSRTIHQENGGSTGKYFGLNRLFYVNKWGGMPEKETFDLPFNGVSRTLTDGVLLPPVVNIQSRELEPHIINYWRNK